MDALILQGLSKRFGPSGRPAVDGLDLGLRAGEFYALLGPNGAGKTTTLRITAGLLPPDGGRVAVFGIDALRSPVEAKRLVAWVPDEPMLYDRLTPMEYLGFVAALWQVPEPQARRGAATLLERLGLARHAAERCGGFSKGMRQKVALAGALIHDPRLIILDEPLTGLDAGSAREVKEMLAERVRAGAAVLLTTHILEVAERMAQRIGIMGAGRLVAEGTLAELRAGRHGAADGGSDAGSDAGRAGSSSLEDIFLRLAAEHAA